MIDIKNLRIVKGNEWTRVVADISSDIERLDSENTIWIAVKNENAHMLESKVYNAFLFLPVYMSMYYNTDLHIHGNVSKKLYKNVGYMQSIIAAFSDKLSKINVSVDGFEESEGEGYIIGTGISCGVDCLQTVYSHFIEEQDPEYRINTLFELNCGWHGYIDGELTNKIFEQRCEENKKVADDLGLSFVAVDSNLHAFLPKLKDQASYFCIYSCVFALERAMKLYYLSSSYSYGEVIKYGHKSRNNDFSEFGDPMLLPLARTEHFELVSDGCQYTRSQKTELIAKWEISKKYLNVCCKNNAIENCSVCHKCVRTLIPLESMGLLEDYKNTFDIDAYKKISYKSKCKMVVQSGTVAFQTDNYRFCKSNGMRLPSKLEAHIYFLPEYFVRLIGKIKRTIIKK